MPLTKKYRPEQAEPGFCHRATNSSGSISAFNACVLNTSDYYPFACLAFGDGMQMPGRSLSSEAYRFGFNTQEKDDEIYGAGNSYSALYWQYDARIGRRWNVGPKGLSNLSRSACLNNNLIWLTDVLDDTSVINISGRVVYHDNDDLRVFLKSGKKVDFIGEIGKEMDLGKVVPNILSKNRKTAKNLNLHGFYYKVKTGNDWDYKNNTKTIFGLVWSYDRKSEKIEDQYTKLIWNNWKGTAADLGNFNFGYNGRYLYEGKGLPTLLLFYGPGSAETKKDTFNYRDATKQIIQMTGIWLPTPVPIMIYPPRSHFGDEQGDHNLIKIGILYAGYEKNNSN